MRIICPACGLSLLVPAENGNGVAKCTRCGKRISWEAEHEDVPVSMNVEDHIGFTAEAIEQRLHASPISKSSSKRILLGVFIGIMVGMLMVLFIVAQKALMPGSPTQSTTALPALVAPPSAWDKVHRAELLQLKDQADSAAVAGDFQGALNAYKQILASASEHEISDPVVLQLVAGARVEQDRVMGLLIASRLPAGTMPAQGGGRSLQSDSTTTQAAAMAIKDNESSTRPATTQNFASTHPTTEWLAQGSAPATRSVASVPPVQLDPAEMAADTAPALPGPPPPAPRLQAFTLPDAVTDEQIGTAILNAVNFLKAHFRNGEITTLPPLPPAKGKAALPAKPAAPQSNLDHASDLGDLPPAQAPINPGPQFTAPWDSAFSVPGVDALCVYALLHAGQAMDEKALGQQDPFVEDILQVLKRYDLIFTYHRSLRAAALSVFNRTKDTAALEDDMRWLLAAGPHGAYTYTLPANTEQMGWDNSNSQYGLLGVWSGAMVGQAVPKNYWFNVQGHWNACANPDGTFGYTQGTSSTTMTCAGVASLLVARDYLDGAGLNKNAGNSPFIDNGLNWLDSGDNCLSDWGNIGGTGYALYGLERVGLASGFKYFGKHDWYAELARKTVAEQHFDGSWGADPPVNGVVAPQSLVDTAYTLLFLARGRHPILFNKLRYEGAWNNRPHEVAHLARFAAHELERPLNWQVVNLRRNWFDWMDSPVLYISGDKKPVMTPRDYETLREFVNGGGLIFTHADNGSAEFNRWVAVDLVRTIFPKYELMQVPREHPLYSTVYRIKEPPPLLAVSNGSRLLLIHSPTDISTGWQLDWTDDRKMAFQLGVNLFVYAAGKSNLKNRLASNYIPEDPSPVAASRPIARLQYAAEWDPEPYAWKRFSRYLQWEANKSIDPIIVQLKDLKPDSVPMAVLTGTVRHDFTAAEQKAARDYVEAGGVLMIDACGGSTDFVQSVTNTLLPQAFEGVSPLAIGSNHPLLIASRPHANDLTHVLLRPFANEHGGKDLPIETLSYGKGWVIFSRLDVTTGLLGTQQWGIQGFDSAYAQALMKNAVLWAFARSPLMVPATKP